MDLWITFKVALKTLYRNKMRTFLTMLGIIIGVGAFVIMLAVTGTAKRMIVGIIQGIGNNSVYIIAASKTKGGVSGGFGSITSLKPSDVVAIERFCPHIKYASANIQSQSRLIYKDRNWVSQVVGGNTNIQYIQAWDIEQGSFFTSQDVKAGAKVCVIGQTIIDNLFRPGEDPIGVNIRINKIPFRIVGVLKKKGGSGIGQDQDDIVFIPYTTMMQRIYKKDYLTLIIASATSQEDTTKAVNEITYLLRQRHRLKINEADDFQIHTQDEILKMVASYTKTLTLLLASVASISLLVGGIGIMNIMLVSVTERIREIGIRMAVGAKQKDVLCQFLIEAITLSLAGGAIGVLGAYSLARLASIFTKWAVYLSVESIILAIIFSSVIGVFFGFYPAWKASRLSPIEALRHE